MWIVLCHPGDDAAVWAFGRFQAFGLEPLRLVSPEMLVYAARSRHWVGTQGVGFVVTLPDGTELNSRDLRGVLNRTAFVPSEHLQRAVEADRQYAQQEWCALYLSWLTAIHGRVVNAAHPLGPGGAAREPLEWALLAGLAGLETPRLRRSSFDAPLGAPEGSFPLAPGGEWRHVLVFAGQVFGSLLPAGVRDACLRLATMAGVSLLGVNLSRGPAGQWTFRSADLLPDLRVGGQRFAEALARFMDATPGGEGA